MSVTELSVVKLSSERKSKLRQRAEAAEKQVADLQKVLDRMDRGEFPVPISGAGESASAPGTPVRQVPVTPIRNGTPGNDILTSGMMGLSPTVAIASRVQKGGKTFTEVYADYVKLQEEYAKKATEYEHMDRTLTAVLAQIEERVSYLQSQFISSVYLTSHRHLSLLNNVKNTSVFKLKPLSWLTNSRKPLIHATPSRSHPATPSRNSLRLLARTKSSTNN